VKNTQLEKGEVISQQSNGVMVMKWRDKKDVTMISTFHDDTLRTLCKRGVEVKKPVCVLEYNQQLGGVNLKDQKLQPYLLEKKRGSKWYMKLFR
jgi:hypothetical protein